MTEVEQVLNKEVFEKLTGVAYDHSLPIHVDQTHIDEILYIRMIWPKPLFQSEHSSAGSSFMRVIHTQ